MKEYKKFPPPWRGKVRMGEVGRIEQVGIFTHPQPLPSREGSYCNKTAGQ